MATKARQQYFADEISLQKQRREFSLEDNIKQKIDSVEEGAQVNRIETVKVNGTALTPDANKAVNVEVPDVIDNLYTQSTDDALSAKQGKVLYDYIQNLQTIGRFLSNWDSATGLPITNPSESPYLYKAGDYYRVSNVAVSPASNYKPDGSSYTIGVASTTVETLSVAVSDLYLYDGTDWILLSNSGSGIAVDSSLSTISTNPVENRVITNALNGKHPGAISNVAPSNPVEGMLWYDTTNDELKAYNGTSWATEGTKMVVLEYGVSTWQNFIDAYNENAIVYCKVSSGGSGYRMAFMAYTAGQGTPTEVEFQYYRSRSSHSQSSTQLDEVYVYKLTNAGVWTTTQRDTGAEMIAGTGIGITFDSSGATIYNSGVTSVNNSTGAVTVNEPKVSATAPASPTEGMLWYDTTNDVLKSYNGSSWDVTGKEYNAGEGISIGTVQDCSAMRGPCSEGFHIPTGTEITNLKDLGVTLGAWTSSSGDGLKQYLKMPFAGNLDSYAGTRENSDSSGKYWGCTQASYTEYASCLNMSSASLVNDTISKCYGCNIRPFKDVSVIPDSSWTTLYAGTGSAGIFHNSTLGLISISSDGTNWITIADKNSGATTVYNSGDTLSEANCGKFYQRGNNYGFAWSGATTTSNQRVDVSAYGPSNPYSSSTFIEWLAGDEDWEMVANADLRGGATGIVQIHNAITNTGVTSVNGQTGDVTISGGDVSVSTDTGNELSAGAKIWLGTESDFSSIVSPDSNTMYIQYKSDGGGGWTPGVNTIAYYPLDGDADDASGNGYDGTATDVTYTTLASGIDVATFNGSSSKIVIADSLVNSKSAFTINVRCNVTASHFGNILDNQSSVYNGVMMDSIDGTQLRAGIGGGGASDSAVSMNTWYNFVLTYDNGAIVVYLNGTQDYTDTHTYSNGTNMTIGAWVAQNRYWQGYISKVIFEDKKWTATEVSNYYDDTKADYGIS